MAAGPWVTYDNAQELFGLDHGGLANLTFKIALFTSSSNANTGTHEEYGDLDNEVAAGNGYTTGGEEIADIAWSETSGTAALTWTTPVVWTASAGNIVARFAVVYIDGTVGGFTDPVVARCLLDSTPADVTVTPPNTLTINPGTGILTLARAA